MTREEFLKRIKEVEMVLIAFWNVGGTPLCIAIYDTISFKARDNFQNKMKESYWPDSTYVSYQVEGVLYFPSYEERFEFKAFFRLICLHEWKQIVLETEAYKEW